MIHFKNHIISPREIKAVLNNIARQRVGYETINQGLHFKNLNDEQFIQNMINEHIRKLHGKKFVSELIEIFFLRKIFLSCNCKYHT